MAEVVEFGRVYRSAFVFRFPPWPGDGFLTHFVTPNVLRKVFNGHRVNSVAFWSPDGLLAAEKEGKTFFKVPPEFKSGRGKPWVAIIEWEKLEESVGGVTQAGVSPEIVVKLIAVAGFTALGLLTFKSFTQVATEARRTVFNPGVVVAAVVIAALIFGRR